LEASFPHHSISPPSNAGVLVGKSIAASQDGKYHLQACSREPPWRRVPTAPDFAKPAMPDRPKDEPIHWLIPTTHSPGDDHGPQTKMVKQAISNSDGA